MFGFTFFHTQTQILQGLALSYAGLPLRKCFAGSLGNEPLICKSKHPFRLFGPWINNNEDVCSKKCAKKLDFKKENCAHAKSEKSLLHCNRDSVIRRVDLKSRVVCI